jgi:thymidylate synthase (FAD)
MTFEKRQVLDHGYVSLVETWGSDARIVEAARMSTDKGFLGWEPEYEYKCSDCSYALVAPERKTCLCPNVSCINHTGAMTFVPEKSHPGDARLLKYLRDHRHDSPFEFAGMVVEVQAPIFVFREWHRHRTQSYNEMSARYTPLPDVNYVPSVERLMAGGGANKQAQGTGHALTEFHARAFLNNLRHSYEQSEGLYQLSIADGVPKELARLLIPVGRYSRMRAAANLRNWLHFLTLRMDELAQWEIRQYANVVGEMIAERFPRTWELFAAVKK